MGLNMDIILPKYIIDSSSLINLKDRYPSDVFTGAWIKMEELLNKKVVASTIEVFHEISSQEDDVAELAKKYKENFLPIDIDVQAKVKEILTKHAALIDLNKRRFDADVFVIATAIVCRATVVTDELKGTIKIPDVCEKMQVPCIGLLAMLRSEGLHI